MKRKKKKQAVCEVWKRKVQASVEIKKKVIEKFREIRMRSPILKTELCGHIFTLFSLVSFLSFVLVLK